MGLNLDQINKEFYKKISSQARKSSEDVQAGIVANKVLEELRSHDTGNKETQSMHDPTEEDWGKITQLQTRIKTWKGYLDSLPTISPIAQDVLKAIEQATFNLSELPKLPETEKIKKELKELTEQYDNKSSERKETNEPAEKQKTDEELIKEITDEIAGMK